LSAHKIPVPFSDNKKKFYLAACLSAKNPLPLGRCVWKTLQTRTSSSCPIALFSTNALAQRMTKGQTATACMRYGVSKQKIESEKTHKTID